MNCIATKCSAVLVDDVAYCHICGKKQTTHSNTQNVKTRGNGQGSVFKAKGRTSWTACVTKYYYVDENGKNKPKRVKQSGFKTKKEAFAFLNELTSKPEKTTPSFSQLLDVYENGMYKKLSKSRQSSYKAVKKKLLTEEVFNLPVNIVGIKELQNVVDAKASTYYPARDMRDLFSLLYQLAIPEGYVSTNLATYITLPELVETEAVPFSKEEKNSLWKLSGEGDSFAPYILLMIHTGMMPGELLAATKENVNFDTQEITGCGKKTKKRKETPIILPDYVIPVVKRIFELSSGAKLIHINEDNFYKEYYACLERAGCDKKPPYSCRHTTGTALGTSDTPIAISQKLMRHSKITSTQRYVHPDRADMHNAANRVESPSIIQ